MKPLTGVAVIALALALPACGGGNSVRDDQAFLKMTAYDNRLSAVDVSTRIDLGHEMCGLLKKHRGNTEAADADMARRGAPQFTPSMMSALSTAAAVAYCPKYR